ncbi:MAG: hypothetical protein N2442_00555 [Spirochaetes bacterium]|nr:hypothetical protein [Spirochaetota bacterium]
MGRRLIQPVQFLSFVWILVSGILSNELLGQVPTMQWRGTIDWQKQLLSLEIVGNEPPSGPNVPAASIAMERRIQQALPRIFIRSVTTLQVDSQKTLGERMEESATLASQVLLAASKSKPGLPRYSPSMIPISIDYRFPLFEVFGPLFIQYTQPMEVPHVLSWVPSANFSGIVIYAKGELPLYGEHRSAQLKPALFPELYMEPMDPVFQLPMGDPSYIGKWGVAAYSSSFDERPFIERIGYNPLRLFAIGLFGKYPTDILLSREDGYKILSRPHNRRLLKEGRILIITDSTIESLPN